MPQKTSTVESVPHVLSPTSSCSLILTDDNFVAVSFSFECLCVCVCVCVDACLCGGHYFIVSQIFNVLAEFWSLVLFICIYLFFRLLTSISAGYGWLKRGCRCL